MFKGDSMYSILPIDATYFFNITKFLKCINIMWKKQQLFPHNVQRLMRFYFQKKYFYAVTSIPVIDVLVLSSNDDIFLYDVVRRTQSTS